MKKILIISLFTIILLALSGCGARATATPTEMESTLAATGAPPPPVNTDGAETKAIPGGMYVLGSSPLDMMAQPQEQPEHKVFLSGFNMYTHEVTNKMYKVCADNGACLPVTSLRQDLAGYYDSPTYDEYPVVGVDWFMATSYCEWAGGRLPTEAEWEVAARGNDERIYPWGNDIATCAVNNMKGCSTAEYPVQVGLYATGNSPFGVWDMAGNVWEWTNDWFDANYYATDPSTDPVGPWSGDYKIIRGGGWNSANDKVRSANRFAIEPELSFKDVGFRCVANEWSVAPNVSIPAESHGRRAGDGRSAEDGPGTPSHELRLISYGIPSSACGAGDTIVFGIAAQNSFGASYVAEIDGNPMTCLYRSNYLLCTAPRRTAATSEGGRLVYRVTIHMVDSGGTRLPDATYGASFTIAGTHFSSCTGSTSVEVTHRENAVCGSAPGPARVVTTVVSPDIIPGTIFLNDAPLSGCIPTSGSMFLCPVPDSVAAGAATLHVVGTLTDGVQPVDYTGAVTIPDCTAGSTVPSLSVSPTCFHSVPSFSFDYSGLMAAGYYGHDIRDGAGNPVTGCVNPGGSTVYCPSPAPGADGNATVLFNIRSRTPPYPETPPQIFTFRPATCEGGGTSGGGWPMMLMGAACHPSGIGFDVTISSLSLVAGVDYLSLATRGGGADTPCGQDSANPAHWHCRVSNPVPTDLQFCYLRASGSAACATFDRDSLIATLPTRCGGSELNDRWSISVDCENHTSDDNLIVNVGILGGRNPYAIKAGYRSTTWNGTPNPGMPNFFQITVPRSFITQDLIFTATFPGEDQLNHTENLTAITPATCKPDDGTGTGIGGLCADNPSASGWQNPANQYDVNNDGCVTPIDVLLVINYLNAHPGVSALPSPRPAGSAFMDVSGDGAATPIDVLMVINYINSHPGVPCVSACAPNGPSTGGEWTLSVICNPTNTRPGWFEFRVHFPGSTTNVNAFGQSYVGCAFGGNPTAGTISQFCPPGLAFGTPMEVWVQRTDGTLDRHTFDNPGALLASTCPNARAIPDIKVLASCSTSTAGTYDLDIVYNPPGFVIYSIYDEAGRVLTQCGTCASGHCHCDGVPVSADGLIHINVDDRNGPEIMYPQVIAPPSCNNTPATGWGFSATCEPGNPNFISCVITYPTSLRITPAVINTRPGWMAWMPDLAGNTISCGFERSNIGTLPFTWEFMGPAPDYASIYHTFTEFPGVIPSVEECSGNTPPTGWTMDMVCTPWLASHFPAGFIGFQIHYPPDITLNLFGEVAGHVNPGCYYTHNEPEHYIQFACPGTWGTDPIWVAARDTRGTIYQLSFPVTTIPSEVCGGTTPTGWSFTPPICSEGGGSIEFNVDHPSELNIASASGQNLSTMYDCGIVNPTRLYCIGRVSTSLATLTIHYTLADGTTGSVDFGTIAAVTPAYCPTPMPPNGGGENQPTCSQYTDSNACGNGGCVWWWGNNTCHPNADPCDKYSPNCDGAPLTCKPNGVICYTP